MSERFYFAGPLALGPVTLDGPEAHHLAAVCRARAGDVVSLFNGDGREYVAEVSAIERQRIGLLVTAITDPVRELPFALEIAAPLPKGDRGEWLIEKLTELGATAFTPLRTRRSVVHPGAGKQDKLRRVVIEASKQSGRTALLDVRAPLDWADFLAATVGAELCLAHPQAEGPVARLTGERRVVAVGPEGGFTDEEVTAAVAVSWRVVGLGPRVLRVETAAIVLAAWAGGTV